MPVINILKCMDMNDISFMIRQRVLIYTSSDRYRMFLSSIGKKPFSEPLSPPPRLLDTDPPRANASLQVETYSDIHVTVVRNSI